MQISSHPRGGTESVVADMFSMNHKCLHIKKKKIFAVKNKIMPMTTPRPLQEKKRTWLEPGSAG